jgi:hypothetical protein
MCIMELRDENIGVRLVIAGLLANPNLERIQLAEQGWAGLGCCIWHFGQQMVLTGGSPKTAAAASSIPNPIPSPT